VGAPLPPAVKKLLIANIACFVVQSLVGARINLIFGLVPALVFSHLYIWQLATYMFLHGSILHILFNMFVLYMFGRELEVSMGSRRFTIFYFFCGIGAGLFSFVFYAPYTVIMGASGAIFGLLVAFAMLFPNRVVTLLIFFVLPVSMRAKHLVMLLAGLEILFTIQSAEHGSIAHFAHIGGAFFGYIYMKNFVGIRTCLERWLMPAPRLAVHEEKRNDADFEISNLRERIDAILDKISRDGLGSLTEEEKRLLRRAKDRL
jgi:membrane associated rhomboid family serine protease